jgi:hypothetical protein
MTQNIYHKTCEIDILSPNYIQEIRVQSPNYKKSNIENFIIASNTHWPKPLIHAKGSPAKHQKLQFHLQVSSTANVDRRSMNEAKQARHCM